MKHNNPIDFLKWGPNPPATVHNDIKAFNGAMELIWASPECKHHHIPILRPLPSAFSVFSAVKPK